MKKIIFLLLWVFISQISFSQDIFYNDYLSTAQNIVPKYLQPWWKGTRIGHVVIVFLDFPDGRYNDNGVLKQPYTDSQLALVSHPDASGEAGVIKSNGIFSLKALKYDWFDRWNMYFDTCGTYYGTANPDFLSHGDSAYGSLRQYWKEASDNHFLMEPYITHPLETDSKLRTGILNDFETVNDRVVIKTLMMPLNKYGSNNSNSYFRDFYDADDVVQKGTRMMLQADTLIRQSFSKIFYSIRYFFSY